MRFRFTPFFLLLTACASNVAVNLLPMYGGVEKTSQQKAIDQQFISTVVRQYGSRKTASKKHSDFGWYYLNKNDPSTAMKRFNQAWLLDSTNAHAYWGFSAIYQALRPDKREEAIRFMESAHKYDPDNYEIIRDLGRTHDAVGPASEDKEKKKARLQKALGYYDKAIEMKRDAPSPYLRAAYVCLLLKDKAAGMEYIQALTNLDHSEIEREKMDFLIEEFNKL